MMKKTGITAFLMVLILCLTLLSGCGSSEESVESVEAIEWSRVGYFTDSSNNFLSVTPSDDEAYEGYYVGLLLGGDSYGWYIPQEGDTLHGNISGSEDKEFIVTVSEEGDTGLLVEVKDGDTYHFTPAEQEEGEEDSDYYSMVTSVSKKNVESLAWSIRAAYLNGNWAEIAELIAYPITMYPEVTVNNADEFISYMSDKTIAESDLAAMEEETCENMFVNDEGICMGSGQVWLSDAGTSDSGDMPLKIIAVSGIEAE